MDKPHMKVCLSVQTLQRLPYYLQYLKNAYRRGEKTVSASAMASELKLGDVSVRKDLALVSSVSGKPKTGYAVEELLHDVELCLGYNNTMDAVLVGVGSLGRALLGNSEFRRFGLNIVAAFDIDEAVVGGVYHGKKVLPMEELTPLCERMHIHIGIVAVPAEFAQEAADHLVACGVRAIWNFALVKLNVPPEVLVQDENLAASLAILSRHLRERMDREKL